MLLKLVAWLDHSKTLRQQHIDEASNLILKRKFFFSDKNIDTRDPIQLNLLYVQVNIKLVTFDNVQFSSEQKNFLRPKHFTKKVKRYKENYFKTPLNFNRVIKLNELS